ncbi:MAG: SusC/RagA family TonB-linked outer membrane protein, partial [Pseudomonadales bacterium]|nr:SusC/RagA family TonB-linked outer membrane protein [Pseudomonadales bacterium]
DATEKVKIGVSLTYSDSENERIANDFSGISVLANALLRNPNLPVRNPDGTYSEDPLGQNGTENPILLANEVTFETGQRRLISNVYAQVDILEGLTFKSTFGFDFLSERTRIFEPSFVLRRQGLARAEAIFIDDFTWVNDNTLSYATTFNEDHRFSALVGLGIQQNKNTRLEAGGNTSGSDIITTIAVANPSIPEHEISEWALLSYFGRFNYNYKDKYLVEGSFRVDGSSRFGENNRYGFFPGISFGWRIAEESFMQNIQPISDMKLRFGIGETGNQDGIGNFDSRTLYGTGRNYDGQPGIAQTQAPNVDLSWESTVTTNVGVDISLFDNRINFSADAYLKKTNDLIFTRQLPYTSGFSSLDNENVGSLENKGLEFSISTRNLTGEFKWTTDLNISINRNEITSLPENGVAGSDLIFKLPNAYDAEGPYSIYRVGESVGSFYGFIYQGVYPTDEDVPANLKDDDNNEQNNYRGGFPIVVDADGNGQYDRQFDRFLIGNALPRSTGGMTNTFSYKGFELSVFVNWSEGNDIYNVTRAVLTGMTGDFNQSAEVLRRWRNPGDVTDVPLALFSASSIQGVSITDASSRYIEDGSFLRIRNVTLSYNLPATLLERIKLSAARIYFTGQNLHTFTSYSGLDPENQNTGSSNVQQTLGADYLTQPQPRVYMVGVNLKF